jgi:hypothetical protein
MASVVAYGRRNGKVGYQYGPKTFDLDLKNVFRAIDFMRLLQKIPTSLPLTTGVVKKLVPKSKLPGIARLEKVADDTAREMMLAELLVLANEMESILISKNTLNRFTPDQLSARTFLFSQSPPQASKMLADYLSEIELNTWGVLRQICFSRFCRRNNSRWRASKYDYCFHDLVTPVDLVQ